MAQVIVSLCDQHLARDEQEPGETWSVTITVPGARPVAYDVELCAACAKPITEVGAMLTEIGRRGLATAPGGRPRKGGPHACPLCDYSGPSRGALGKHTRDRHGATLSGVVTPDAGGNYPCPMDGCDRTFPTQQGVRMHITRSHAAERAALADSPEGGKST